MVVQLITSAEAAGVSGRPDELIRVEMSFIKMISDALNLGIRGFALIVPAS